MRSLANPFNRPADFDGPSKCFDPDTPFRKSFGDSLIRWFPRPENQEAGSAVQGLTQLDTLTQQLIFIDIHLPDSNGLDLAKTIKQFYPQIVIAVFTRYDSPEYRAAANNSGVAHLIPKNERMLFNGLAQQP